MTEKSLVPWVGPEGLALPPSIREPSEILRYAVALKPADQLRIVSAFASGHEDMAAEFVWRRSMTRLRDNLAQLGMRFVGEMLDREDVDESSSPANVLTDYDSIRLAEALGVVNATGALRLRHALELITHFASGETEEQLGHIDAVQTVRACVQYLLGSEDIRASVDFSEFRERLLTESIQSDDGAFERLRASPVFFVRTTLRTLLAAVKSEHGARLEHALNNLVTALPIVWDPLPETDRWSVGMAYSEASAFGNEEAMTALKRGLIRVRGFDYVPEDLRSRTFKKAAQAVMAAHHGWNNFYNEPGPTRYLSGLGTTIPPAALAECMQAYLSVYLGNRYGVSWDAASVSLDVLKGVPESRWQYYLEKMLVVDDEVLRKLTQSRPVGRFCELADELGLANKVNGSSDIFALLQAAEKRNTVRVQSRAEKLLQNMGSAAGS
ncbi:MAG: hypothetical protein H6730_01365 [Deltaproteobacteria bacterium]|nr:hypothetical protein [Deltaproteobacteria bacterium]